MHQDYMHAALQEAHQAFAEGEVPVGAVLVIGNRIIAANHNRTEHTHDPLAHAELLVIRDACRQVQYERLLEASLYVTVEPCIMCAGALVLARVQRLIYGTPNPKAGAIRSLYQLVQDTRLNHQIDVIAGILEPECRQLMTAFFQHLRRGEVPKWS